MDKEQKESQGWGCDGVGCWDKDLHCLPAVGAEEEVDGVVVHFELGFEVRVDHLADGGGAVWEVLVSSHGEGGVDDDIPGNRITFTFFPCSRKRFSRRPTWVVLPLRSRPSRTIRAPRTMGRSSSVVILDVMVVVGLIFKRAKDKG